jgi:hypothetical protein
VPVIDDVSYDEENGNVTITASDNYGLLCAEAFEEPYDIGLETNKVEFELIDGAYTATLDVSELGDNYNIYVYDYAYNYTKLYDNKEVFADITVKDVSESYNGSILNKTIKITNNSDESKKLTPIFAIYDKDEKLLKTVVGNEKTINGNSSIDYTFEAKLTAPDFPDLKLPNGATTKVFLWDSLNDMHPVEYEKQN